jgi:hypothetical protein
VFILASEGGGGTAKKIARQLKLSLRTSEDYINQLKMKFNVSNKSDVIEKVIEHGFLGLLPDSFFSQLFSAKFSRLEQSS